MNDKQLIKRIIELALKIKETDNLTEVADEIKQMELEKMFTTKHVIYFDTFRNNYRCAKRPIKMSANQERKAG